MRHIATIAETPQGENLFDIFAATGARSGLNRGGDGTTWLFEPVFLLIARRRQASSTGSLPRGDRIGIADSKKASGH
jgi:hypothetical protein